MPKQVSNIKVQGTVDGITYFERNGEFLAMKKPKRSKEARDANPRLEDFRNQGKEFGGGQRPVGGFNEGFDTVKTLFTDKTLSKRLASIFRLMIKRAPGDRGSRPVQPVVNKDLLEGLELNDGLWLGEVIKVSGIHTINAGRNEVSLTLQPFVPLYNLKAPVRATHFEIVNYVAILSSYEFNAEEKTYNPVDKVNNSKKFSTSSALLPINDENTETLTIVTSLTGVGGIENLAPASAVMACIGIRFYEERLGKSYPIATGAAMKLQKVF
jgi:hypothetical protein